MPTSDTGLKPALERLGLKQAEFARLLDVSARTVSLWATGGQALPGAVAGYLRLLEAAPLQTRQTEFARLTDRGKLLEDGLYRIDYQAGPGGESDRALAVMRQGKLKGADRHGGMFTGNYRFDRPRGLNIVHFVLTFAPDKDTGGEPRPDIECTCAIARPDPVARTSVTIAGQPFDIVLIYLGPLPE